MADIEVTPKITETQVESFAPETQVESLPVEAQVESLAPEAQIESLPSTVEDASVPSSIEAEPLAPSTEQLPPVTKPEVESAVPAVPVESPIPSTTKLPSEEAVKTPLPPTKSAEDVSRDISFEEDPSKFFKAKVESLIYWESPKNSAIFLAGFFSLLTLSQYYSALQLITGLFTLATGINWAYVNLHKQSQKMISNKQPQDIINPHSRRLQVKTTFIPRERVLRVAHFLLDSAEVGIEYATKIVLVEDNARSVAAFAASFFVWTLTKCVSTKNILGAIALLAFSLPRLYLQHKEVVDAHVAKHSQTARSMAEKYGVTKVFL